MFFNRQTTYAVYISCFLLFGAVLVANGLENLDQTFLKPLDNSYSILGSHSVFKDYLGSQKVYAFLPYWNLDDHDLNLEYLTDVSYFGLNVDSKGRIITNDGNYKKWRENKQLAQAIKEVREKGGSASFTLVCQNDEDIDAVLACTTCWENLARDVKRELEWAKIKDINVDFEYSGYTTPENAQKYSQMVGFLNNQLDAAFGESFVVVSTYADAVDRSTKDEVRLTDPKSLAQNADALFIMAYDFHRPTSNNAGPISPLDGSYTTTKLNLTKMLAGYLQAAPASKLILGLPFYGYDWVVEDSNPMSTRVEGNDYVGFSRVISYAEVTDLLIKKQIKPQWDELSKSPYFNYVDEETGSKRQIWYDDEKSLGYKVALANKNHLLGVGVWALGYEGGYSDLWKIFKPQP